MRKYKKRNKSLKSPFAELFKLLFDFIRIAIKEAINGNYRKALMAFLMVVVIIIIINIAKTEIRKIKSDAILQLLNTKVVNKNEI